MWLRGGIDLLKLFSESLLVIQQLTCGVLDVFWQNLPSESLFLLEQVH